MSLRAVNLNLIPVLQALLRERSVSLAATRLGMSQSAASEALSKLRTALGDPLLVRSAGRTELTPRAVELCAPVEALCASLESFYSQQGFDPVTARRTFVIAASDFAIFMLAEALLKTLDRVSPQIHIRFVGVTDALVKDLDEREIDFAFVPSFFTEDLAPAPLRFRGLFREHAVVIFRNGHPLADRTEIAEQDLSGFRLISFHPGTHAIERKRANAYIGRRPLEVAAEVPQVTLAPFLVVDTDYCAIVPSRLADRMTALLPLQSRPMTFAPNQFDLGMAWSPVQDADHGHRWFREMAERLLKDPGLGAAGPLPVYD